MVAMIVRIQYACVAEIHRLKIKRIYNNAWWKRVLICEQSCVNMFNEQYDQCPCQVGISYAAYGLYVILYESYNMIQDIKKSILERIGISDKVSFNDF